MQAWPRAGAKKKVWQGRVSNHGPRWPLVTPLPKRDDVCLFASTAHSIESPEDVLLFIVLHGSHAQS